MLKQAIYFNVVILFIMSIVFLIITFNKKSEFKKLKQLIIVYMIYNFISLLICYSGIVEINWNIFLLLPVHIISFVLYIIAICHINKKLKKVNIIYCKKENYKKNIIILVIPIIIFIIPYIYELYLINNCEYLLKYNYQDGIIISEDTYITIINNTPIPITLQKNLFNRKGKNVNYQNYNVIYKDDIEITKSGYGIDKITIENDEFKKIALNAKGRCNSAKGAELDYFPEKKYSIITLLSEETHGTVLGEYFYYGDTYVQNINTHGSLESVMFYE